MESPHQRALREFEEVFGDRLKRGGPDPPGVQDAGVGLTRFREPIRVKRSSSMKGVEEDGQERQAVSA